MTSYKNTLSEPTIFSTLWKTHFFFVAHLTNPHCPLVHDVINEYPLKNLPTTFPTALKTDITVHKNTICKKKAQFFQLLLPKKWFNFQNCHVFCKTKKFLGDRKILQSTEPNMLVSINFKMSILPTSLRPY